ncbi:hypothetical protein Hanom_Chr09g00870821 [Helianthus anomalus]
MADQGVPFPPLGSHSQIGTAAGNSHAQNQPIDEYAEGECTKIGAIRASGTRTAQTVTLISFGAGPSAPAMSGLPEGEAPASWYAKSQETLNLIYAQLCAQ